MGDFLRQLSTFSSRALLKYVFVFSESRCCYRTNFYRFETFLKNTILETFNTVNTNIFVLVFKCSFIPIIHVTLLDNNIFNVFIV